MIFLQPENCSRCSKPAKHLHHWLSPWILYHSMHLQPQTFRHLQSRKPLTNRPTILPENRRSQTDLTVLQPTKLPLSSAYDTFSSSAAKLSCALRGSYGALPRCLRTTPQQRRSSCGARNSLLAIRIAEFRPLRQQILPVSATGGGQMCCL